MPRFVLDRDLTLFRQISKELVEDVIETPVVIYQVSPYDTSSNLYGESLNKTYQPGVLVYALIPHEPQASSYEGFGADINQSVEFRFQRNRLEDAEIYPQQGDIVEWNNAYFEIGHVVENQMPGGLYQNIFSIVCQAHMVRRSKLNLEPRIK